MFSCKQLSAIGGQSEVIMLPVIWLLGLSGSGKTTLGSLLRIHLESGGHDVEHIDGDVFRKRFGFHGFSYADRMHNINAMREYTLENNLKGKVCIVTAITPYAPMRKLNREILPHYREVWVRCSLDELVRRDPKGLYAKAGRGELQGLTGVADAFDEPVNADLIIDTDKLSLAQSYNALVNLTDNALETGTWGVKYMHLSLPGANISMTAIQ